MPTYPTISDAYVRNYIGTLMSIDQQLEEQRTAAMRWQGARDYDTLIQSGVEPRDALRRSAAKLFYNDPRALAATVPSLVSEPGGLMTDPETGRRFTVDRFGNYKAVSEPQYGWRKVTDPFGQSYTVRLGPGEQVPTGQEPRVAPPVYNAPGGGRFFLLPGGQVRSITRDPVQSAQAKEAMKAAQEKAAPILEQYGKWKAEWATGAIRPGYLGFGETYKEKMARAEEQLKQLGFDTEGSVIPESRLGRLYYGETPAPETGMQILPPGSQIPTAPIPSIGMQAPPTAPPPGPAAAPVRPRLQRVPLPGGGFMLRQAPTQATQAPPPAAGQASAPVQPGGDWVIKYRADNGQPVLVNKRTGERRPYAQ